MAIQRVTAQTKHNRRGAAPASKAAEGVYAGSVRELNVPTVDGIKQVRCMSYSMAELSEYLGRTKATIGKWVRDKVVSPPLYTEYQSAGRVKYYTTYEAEAIRLVVIEHEKSYSSLCTTHANTIRLLAMAVHAPRVRLWDRSIG